MTSHPTQLEESSDELTTNVNVVLKKFWGFETLRPMQMEAIRAGLGRRDSLVVLPTGGGKSLCYQVPPLVANRTDVVVSPLISLMKDQVDGLREIGYPAAALHSGLPESERREVEREISQGKYKLIFVAPERLMNDWFLSLLARANVSSFAIDEAHCISQWGHDFRPEYRQLASLRNRFPNACLHAFTATATPRVRQDIAEQLKLNDPAVLVGSFDRPNLVYRVLPRMDLDQQVLQVVKRHRGEAAIVYCLSRKDTEHMAEVLRSQKVKAAHYHAGLTPEQRQKTQEAFANEALDVVVATVAFGMGIDRSNVRCVIHAGLPKSVEGYQQETGRAGRDGLASECVMFYSHADTIRLERLIEMSAENAPDPQAIIDAQRALLEDMQKIAASHVCRHKALSEYFGQAYHNPNCGACDVCLDEVEDLKEGTVTAQKILSAVARTGQRFGVGHVADVLQGANTEMVRSFGHSTLSVYGLMRDVPKKHVQSLCYQLLDQGLLERTGGDRPIMRLTADGLDVMRGKKQVRLVQPKQGPVAKTRAETESWDGIDMGLVTHLRAMRKSLADARGMPAFMIFDDKSLRDLASKRPSSLATLKRVTGFGDKRVGDIGQAVIEAVAEYCAENDLSMDAELESESESPAPTQPKLNSAKSAAFELFDAGESLDSAASKLNRAASTVRGYLLEYIQIRKPAAIDTWVPPDVYDKIMKAAGDTPQLRPIFDALAGTVSFDQISIVIAHMRASAE